MTSSNSKLLQKEALERLVHATSGQATIADLRDIETWRARSAKHAEAYRSALKTWEALGTAATESVTAEDRAVIAGRFAAPVPMVSRRMMLTGGFATAAAAAGGLAIVRPPLGLWPSLSELMADYRTGAGQQRTVVLADDVTVEMNTRTSIVRRASNSDGERLELVLGEVVISTTDHANKPFTVIADPGRVTAEKAQFNVRHDPTGVRVTCLQGTVKVDCPGGTALLHPDEQVNYSASSVGSATTIDPERTMAWRQGLLIFRDEPLGSVLEEVNRYWRGKIVLLNNDLAQRHVTVRIELARIEEVIPYVRQVLGATVRTLPGGVVLLT